VIIKAAIRNGANRNEVSVSTDGNAKSLQIPGKTEARGSLVNGGELLFLSLATCFCNDIYREAARRKMEIEFVTVEVSGNFGKEGEPASNIVYSVKIDAPKSTPQEITDLINQVDKVAEVHNTLRTGVNVELKS
jgi:organic hydroperoxide reductase OsmC/OhrA